MLFSVIEFQCLLIEKKNIHTKNISAQLYIQRNYANYIFPVKTTDTLKNNPRVMQCISHSPLI